MGFNRAKFIKEEMEHRTEEVGIPSLSQWFGKDDKPIFLVRGLSGSEISMSQNASVKNKNLTVFAEAIAGGTKNEKVKALKEIIGNADSVPEEISRRMEMLTYGSIEPVIDLQLAIKLNQHFPSEFMIITSKIIELTALGSDVVKQKPSGKIKQ